MNELLDSVLDTLIPPSEDGRMPGAGSLELGEAVRTTTAAYAALVDAGLSAAEDIGFRSLDLEARVLALREIDSSQPGFAMALYAATCSAYYQHPAVLVGLGLEPRPPHPQGYELEAGDLTALDRVRARGRLFRPT